MRAKQDAERDEGVRVYVRWSDDNGATWVSSNQPPIGNPPGDDYIGPPLHDEDDDGA